MAITLFCLNILAFIIQLIGVATGFIQIRQPNSSSNLLSDNLNSTQLLEMQKLLQVYQSGVKNESGKLDSLLNAEKKLLDSERETLRESLAQLNKDRDFLKNLLKSLNGHAATCRTELVSCVFKPIIHCRLLTFCSCR